MFDFAEALQFVADAKSVVFSVGGTAMKPLGAAADVYQIFNWTKRQFVPETKGDVYDTATQMALPLVHFAAVSLTVAGMVANVPFVVATAGTATLCLGAAKFAVFSGNKIAKKLKKD